MHFSSILSSWSTSNATSGGGAGYTQNRQPPQTVAAAKKILSPPSGSAMTHASRCGTISQVDALRVAMVSITSMAMAVFSTAGPASADPPLTQVITTVAVGPNGQPIDGYQEAPTQGNVVEVNDCTTPSPSAVANNIYYCSPSAAAPARAGRRRPDRCYAWTTRGTKSLHRVTYGDSLPPVQAVAAPDPFALALDDGTHCLLRNGGAWGGRDDGYVGTYWCRDPSANLAVLCLPSQGAGTCIDRLAPVWTVKVGQLGTPTTRFPPPRTRAVTSAWFAGN
jgi:hypothetical protein